MKALRVLCLSGVWPHATAATEAATSVSFAICRELARTGFSVAFGYVNAVAADWPAAAATDRQELSELSVEFMDPVILDEPPLGTWRSRAVRLFSPSDTSAVPGARSSSKILDLVRRSEADVVLTIWSELASAAVAPLPIPKVAYYGNIAPRLTEAAFALSSLLEPPSGAARGAATAAKERLALRAATASHLRVMRGFDLIAEVAANDAAWYQAHGLPAVYLRNMWPNPAVPGWEETRDSLEQEVPLRIVGNVGNLSATGNSFGLHTLATQVLPELRRSLGDGGFEIHLYGGRQPHPRLRPYLDDPHIRLRGFVADIDREILSAPIFLVANNNERFKVGHTRFLHAWSLGACAVAFRDCREAMPEIEHDRNALLAGSPAELADLISAAARDRLLRRRIGRGGAESLRAEFSPELVVAHLARHLQHVASSGKRLSR